MPRTTGTVLITGGTSGLGYEAALHITQKAPEWYIILASRTNSEYVHERLNEIHGHNAISYQPLDLASQNNIYAFVRDFASKGHPPITALLLNGGLQLNAGLEYSEDGIEKTFAINHVGHALLFFLLRPYLADGCRIIITASGTHDPEMKTMVPDAIYNTAEQLAHPTPDQIRKYRGRQVYATSKLCNVLWTYGLHRRLVKGTPQSGGAKWTVTAFDPGLMPGTGLARDASAIQRFIWHSVLTRFLPLLRRLITPNIHTTEESGDALADLVVYEVGECTNGVYMEGQQEIRSSKASYDEAKQEDLWNWTIEALARDEDEKRAFEDVYPIED